MGTLKVNGDLTLVDQSSRIPTLTWIRGTNSDTYTDWRIQSNGGNLYFQNSINGTNWLTSIQLNEETQGGTIITPYAITATGGFNGNATSASKLANARIINGTSFDGSSDITFFHNYSTTKAASLLPNAITAAELPATPTAEGDPTYGALLTFKLNNNRAGQIAVGEVGSMKYRSMHQSYADTNYGYTSWKTVLDDSNYNSYALPLTGGSLSGGLEIWGGALYLGPSIHLKMYHNGSYNTIIHNHNNGNISIRPAGGSLYLGYDNSNDIYCRKGNYVNIDAGNYGNYALPLSGGTVSGAFGLSNKGVSSSIYSQNSGFLHYSTDAREGHWFNTDVKIQGNIYAGANYNDLVLTSSNYASYAMPASYWNWHGNGGQPTWLWGGNEYGNFQVWNPANFSVNYANSAGKWSSARTISCSGWVSGSVSLDGSSNVTLNCSLNSGDGRSIRTPGSGWYCVAYCSGSLLRGIVDFYASAPGGNMTPFVSYFRADISWGNYIRRLESFNSAEIISDFRITTDGTYFYLECYFTKAAKDTTLWRYYNGWDYNTNNSNWNWYSGDLPASVATGVLSSLNCPTGYSNNVYISSSVMKNGYMTTNSYGNSLPSDSLETGRVFYLIS